MNTDRFTSQVERARPKGGGQHHKMALTVQATHETIYWNKRQTNETTIHLGSTTQNYLWPRHLVHSTQQETQTNQKLRIGRGAMPTPENPMDSLIGNNRSTTNHSQRLCIWSPVESSGVTESTGLKPMFGNS